MVIKVLRIYHGSYTIDVGTWLSHVDNQKETTVSARAVVFDCSYYAILQR